MRFPRLKVSGNFRLTIRAKLLLMSGILMLALVGTNLFMRSQLVAGSDALGLQTRLHDMVRVANSALRESGELKYWLTDLEVTWLNESETKAEEARAALDQHLQELSAIASEEVEKIKAHVATFVERSLEAVDAYVDENRVLGNSLVAQGRESIEIVDRSLVAIVDDLVQKATAAETAAGEGAEQATGLSLIVMFGAGLISVLLTWLALRSIVTPIKKMVIAMTEVSQGKTDVEVPPVSRDEIGELAVNVPSGRAATHFRGLHPA